MLNGFITNAKLDLSELIMDTYTDDNGDLRCDDCEQLLEDCTCTCDTCGDNIHECACGE